MTIGRTCRLGLHDAGDLGSKLDRRTFEQAAGEANRPGARLFFWVSMEVRRGEVAFGVCASARLSEARIGPHHCGDREQA